MSSGRMKSAPDMRPSDVVLLVPCLVGTLGRSEREMAAALIVRACQLKGDQWGSVGIKEIGETIDADIAAGRQPLAALNRSSFCPRPDFRDLVKEGFARFDGDPEKDASASIELTHKALRAIRRRWYRPSDKPCPKCATLSRCVEWMKDMTDVQPDSPEAIFGPYPILVGGLEFREAYACPVHEEFGFLEDGTPYFFTPEMWVTGPDGKRLFCT